MKKEKGRRRNNIASADTRHYHLHHPIDLMTEFTVCESLGHSRSPYLRALALERTYGAILGDRLREKGLLRQGCRLCEIGGGYGSLMRGLMEAHEGLVERVAMAGSFPGPSREAAARAQSLDRPCETSSWAMPSKSCRPFPAWIFS